MAETAKPRNLQDQDMAVLARTLEFAGAPAELRKLLPSLTLMTCAPGQVLVKEGELGSDMFVLLKGTTVVRRSRWVIFKRDVARLQAGDFFGEIGFLVPAERSASVVALTACEMLKLVSDDLKNLLDRDPEMRRRLEETARQRLYDLSAVDS